MQIHRGDVAQNTKVRKLIVGSMDIEKLCPNTKIRPTANKINEMYVKSILKIKGLKYGKVARYLGKFMTREEILL